MQKQKIRWKISTKQTSSRKYQKKRSLQLLILPHCVLEQFTFSIHCEIDSSRPIMFVVKGIFLELAQWVKTFFEVAFLFDNLFDLPGYLCKCHIYIRVHLSLITVWVFFICDPVATVQWQSQLSHSISDIELKNLQHKKHWTQFE